MQVSNSKSNGMQEGNESSVRKVNKNKINAKMNKNQNAASSTPENSNESPQNVRLDTSESEEESVSEVMGRSYHGFIVNFVILKTPKKKIF
jgi:hypothetical protein